MLQMVWCGVGVRRGVICLFVCCVLVRADRLTMSCQTDLLGEHIQIRLELVGKSDTNARTGATGDFRTLSFGFDAMAHARLLLPT